MPSPNERWAEATAQQATGLIRLLTETYPVTPQPSDSEREVWMKLGAQRLMTHLKTLAEAGGSARFA